MSKEDRLLRIAEKQQGYFTTKQAEACGFARSNFPRKVRAGKWEKEAVRGVYRLAHFPASARPELALWTLWSADKYGRPQGVWSHETALEVHNLSDVAPSKLHMSVPKKFRKGSAIPHNICLHFVDSISASEVETHQGYRVTTPLRTLSDIIRLGETQPDQVQRAILDFAIQNALSIGSTTIQAVEDLARLSGSNEMREIIAKAVDEVWTRANVRLIELGRRVEPFTIGLILDGQPKGTAVLCKYKARHFLLTATHVARAIRKAHTVNLVLRFDVLRREYPPRPTRDFSIIEWDNSFHENMLNDVLRDQPCDLAVVIPSQEIVNVLSLYKDFYAVPTQVKLFSMDEVLVSMGGIEPLYSDGLKTCQMNVGPYGFVASSYSHAQNRDYVVCPVSNHTYDVRNLRRKAITSFAGLSGSGLWSFPKDSPPSLVGIAIAQDPAGYDSTTGLRHVYFHGPQSIHSALKSVEYLL